MLKWKLFIKTLPMVLGVIFVALVRDYLFQLEGLIEFSDVSPLLAPVALIVGFMLAGVLGDYKESEKIPGEIASVLETIHDTLQVVLRLNPAADASQIITPYRHLAATVEKWFLRQGTVEECYRALEDMIQVATQLHTAAGVNYTIRCLAEMHNLRRLITRVDVITHTSFITAGYALLDLLVATTLTLLLIANYKTMIAEYTLISLFSLIYLYLVQLIRDIDTPFAYDAQKNLASSAEVDPYPLQRYQKRLENQKN